MQENQNASLLTVINSIKFIDARLMAHKRASLRKKLSAEISPLTRVRKGGMVSFFYSPTELATGCTTLGLFNNRRVPSEIIKAAVSPCISAVTVGAT